MGTTQPRERYDRCRIIYFNATSVKNKLNEVEILRNSNKYDVICISETWCNETISDAMLCGDAFTCVRKDRSDRRGGGVCILIRNELKFANVEIDAKYAGIECVTVKLLFAGRTICLSCVYHPPNSNPLYSDLLFELLSNYCRNDDSVIIVGDFNLPNIQWNEYTFPSSSPYDTCQDFVFEFDLHQIIRKPTFGNNILDWLLCSDESVIDDLTVTEGFSTSLHSAVEFCVLGARTAKGKKFIKDFRKADFDAISLYLNEIIWAEEFSICVTVNDFWEVFRGHMQFIIEFFVPSRELRKPCSVHSSRLTRLKNKKKAKYRKWKAQRDKDRSAKNEYVSVAAEYKTEAKRLRDVKEKKILSSGNVKSFYSYVNSRLKRRDDVPVLKDDRGNAVVGDRDKAEILNNFFASVFTNDDGSVSVQEESP